MEILFLFPWPLPIIIKSVHTHCRKLRKYTEKKGRKGKRKEGKITEIPDIKYYYDNFDML